MINILLVGSGAREHAIARAIKRSRHQTNLFCLATNNNPALRRLCFEYIVGNITKFDTRLLNIKQKIDFAIIGPETALAAGIVDTLAKQDIPAVGPSKKLAQIETSKGFARNLLTKHNILASPKYRLFNSIEGVKPFLEELGAEFVVKADGLKGGKGVKISGEHLSGHDNALKYCNELLAEKSSFVIEEKLIGQEFSLLSFSDGKTLRHMPPVRDYKRAFVGDKGPNTGGMGSYSLENHLLPFLTEEDRKQAEEINEVTIKALYDEFKTPYKGILYGGFIVTKKGVGLIEYNARFGDPEAINILALLETDFVEICYAIIEDRLSSIETTFLPKATVCKYIVPKGYPDSPAENEEIDLSQVVNLSQIYYASIEERSDKIYTGRSRSLAVLGIGKCIEEAEEAAEKVASKISGSIYYRQDVGVKLQ